MVTTDNDLKIHTHNNCVLKTLALVFGIIMVAIGALGFVPEATPDNLLFGIFHVDLLHNLIHLLTGVFAIICGLISHNASRIYFQVFSIVYAVVTVLGFYYDPRPILDLIANNMPDNWLHVAITLFTFYLGYIYKEPIIDHIRHTTHTDPIDRIDPPTSTSI